jgi:hypothetical protein
MKRSYLTLVAAVICTFAAVSASVCSAQTATFSYNDGNGIGNAGSYTPGSSFSFSITLAFAPGGAVTNLEGLSYWFEQQSPSAPFNFAITNRDATGSQFTLLQTPGLTYPQNMTPQNTNDLGASLPGATGVGAGNYFIANLTISISGTAAPGVYQIENTTTAAGKRSIISDDQGHTFGIPQAIYTITVVPEPGITTLFIIGLSALGFCFRRRLVLR